MLALGITSRVRNVEISKVLENLAKNYKAEFPFLIHYEEIKKLYDKLAEQYTYFQVMILKHIALELIRLAKKSLIIIVLCVSTHKTKTSNSLKYIYIIYKNVRKKLFQKKAKRT